MVKDRLKEMKALQEDGGGGPKEITVDFDTEPQNMFLEKFYEHVQKILILIDKLKCDVEDVKTKHVEILYSLRPNPTTHQNLQDTMTDITKTALQIRAKLKVIQVEIDLIDNQRKNSAYARIRQTQYAMLTRKFLDVMQEYNEEELDYRERCKNRIRRHLESTSNRIFTDEELEDMIDKEDPTEYSQSFLEQTDRTKESLADIQARHSDIVNLEKSIQQLNTLFKDMLMITLRQGAMVDSIENHVQQAGEYVEVGYQEIVTARKYRKNVRRKRCILIICLVIIIIILVVAIPLAVGSPVPD